MSPRREEPRSPIYFPLGGLSDDFANSRQPPGTTRDAKNVRAIDPRTGRTRGAQRAGMTRHNPNAIGSGKIQHLSTITYDQDIIDYTAVPFGTDPTRVWSRNTPSVGHCRNLKVDRQGNVYALDAASGLAKFNSDGALVWKFSFPVQHQDHIVRALAVDAADGSVYAGVSGGPDQGAARLWKFSPDESEDGSLVLDWFIEENVGGGGRYFEDIVLLGGTLYTIQVEDPDNTPLGWLVVYQDLRLSVPTMVFERPTFSPNVARPNSLAVASDGSIFVTGSTPGGTAPYLVKYDPGGAQRWTHQTSGFTIPAGFGFGVAVNSEGDLYTCGPHVAGDQTTYRKIIDTGDNGQEDWTKTRTAPFDYFFPRLAVDEFDNAYFPVYRSTASVPLSFLIVASDGTTLHNFATAGKHQAHALAPSVNNPDYGSDLTRERAQYFYAGLRIDEGQFVVHKYRLVDQAITANQQDRATALIAVVDGDVKLVDDANLPTIPSGGAGALNANASYIADAEIFGKRYLSDGDKDVVFDPVANTVAPYTSTSGGEIPRRARLQVAWRGRIVRARTADKPYNWYMSAIDDPGDWDEFPPVVVSTQAIQGNNPRTGASTVPDLINALIPYSDDLLIFGGDRSIHRLTGDPMDDGQLHLVSDTVGMAFGNPWAKDPSGYIYFLGSKGGVWRMAPYAPLSEENRISRRTIERRLQAIDMTKYRVRLVWNYFDEGLHIFQFPFGAGGESVAHWFWDSKNGAWWEDQFGSDADTSVQPTAVTVLDGDLPGDRVMLLGCEDSFIRRWDQQARSDDTLPVASTVTMGPLLSPEVETAAIFKHPALVLADDGDGCSFDIFASSVPDVLGSPQVSISMEAGRNPPKMVRARGNHVWVRLSNSALNQTWAMESLSMGVEYGGMRRASA